MDFARRGRALILLVASALLIGCGGEDGGAPHRVIDEQAASYRGVGFGDARSELFAAFGSAPRMPQAPVTPLGRDLFEVHKSPITDCRTGTRRGRPWGEWRRYEHVSFLLDDGRVCGFIVIEDGAATTKGVAIGDPLEDVERKYPKLTCGIVNYASEGEDLVPACAGKLGALEGPQSPPARREPGRWIWFGGDPIDTIQMNSERFGVDPQATQDR